MLGKKCSSFGILSEACFIQLLYPGKGFVKHFLINSFIQLLYPGKGFVKHFLINSFTGFKQFLTEWFCDKPEQLAKLNSELEELRNLVATKDFHEAGLKLQKLWMVVEKGFLDAKRKNKEEETTLLLPILKELHKINKTYKNIRNVATKEY